MKLNKKINIYLCKEINNTNEKGKENGGHPM